MSLLQLVIISIVQGISEWLPISSSAHVLLTANLFGISGEDELMVNAMAHLGTLFALFAYFWRDTVRVITGSFELVGIGRENGRLSQGGKLALLILVATPPALVAGLVYELAPGLDVLRSPHVIAAATIVFGLLLWWADVKGPRHRTEADMTLRDGVLIGTYNFADQAERFAAMSWDKQFSTSRASVDQIHPGKAVQLRHPVGINWMHVPYSMGAWASESENDHPSASAVDAVLEGDGPIVFAGQHLSPIGAWMEAAIRSSHYAVAQIHDRTRAN